MSGYTVVGGGLAGLLLLQALLDKGVKKLRLVHEETPLQASDAPLALCHPFPGRSLKPHPLLEEAYRATQLAMHNWRELAPHLVQTLTMRRPLAGANHDRLLRTYNTHWHNHPRPWLTITVDPEKKQLSYSPCYAVSLGQLREPWLEHLVTRGVEIVTGSADSVGGDGREVTVSGQTLASDKTILCTGAALTQWLPHESLLSEGGELGIFGVPQPMDHLLSQAGLHAGPLDEKTIVIGSTRWEEQPEGDAERSLPFFEEKMSKILNTTLNPSSAWRGVRSIESVHRLPIIGALTDRTNTYVFGALGSKGLLWGPLAASRLASHLTDGAPIPSALDVKRLCQETP